MGAAASLGSGAPPLALSPAGDWAQGTRMTMLMSDKVLRPHHSAVALMVRRDIDSALDRWVRGIVIEEDCDDVTNQRSITAAHSADSSAAAAERLPGSFAARSHRRPRPAPCTGGGARTGVPSSGGRDAAWNHVQHEGGRRTDHLCALMRSTPGPIPPPPPPAAAALPAHGLNALCRHIAAWTSRLSCMLQQCSPA